MNVRRVESLDWQRGLLAVSIMLYHLTGWELAHLDSSTLLGRLGVYGVSMFFVLSGLSMAIVYNSYISSFRTAAIFFARRIFRIWPLLWLAIFAVTLGKIFLGKEVSWDIVVINLTTLFGFFMPDAYINTGAWSIGNEMVYYSMTPFIIYLYGKKIIYGNAFCFISILLGLFFSIYFLTPAHDLAMQWGRYVNPFNNLFLYCCGVAIYYNVDRNFLLGKAAALAGFFIFLSVFIFYPAAGDQINIVTGFARFVFSFISVALVLVFYGNPFFLPKYISIILTKLGMITFGVYLLHPVVYQILLIFLKKFNMQIDAYSLIAIVFLLTIVSALVSFKLIESPFIKLGKRLTTKKVDYFYSEPFVAGR